MYEKLSQTPVICVCARERERMIYRSPATCVALCDVITSYHQGM
jgi:hypothetical protein